MTQEDRAQGDLVARMARLERQNRFLKAGLAGIVVVVGLVTCLSVVRAASPLETVTAKRFVLEDDRGQERAVLGFDAAGLPRLSFIRPDGTPGLSLSDGPQMFPAR
jgi:hypothetical protein